MDDQEYIVFEAVSTGAGEEAFAFRPSAEEEPATAKLNVQTLSPTDVADARQAPGTVVAQPLPTALIEPVAESDVQPAATGPTWGVEAVGASSSPFSGKGVKVAVLDTGIDASHPAFAGLKLTEKDFTGEGNGDKKGHGTHCAGTIAGRDVDGVRIGIAREIDELLVGKVLGARGGSTAAAASAMLWALENGANVFSMSLGIDFPGAVKRATDGGMAVQPATSFVLQGYRDNLRLFGSIADLLASSNAFGRPAVVAAATGNESERGGTPSFTIDASPPAASEGFIRCAALQKTANGFSVARFSNTGATVSAPGVDIVSAKRGGGLTTMSGTSMATPHVAGIAALWAEKLTADNRFTPDLLMASLTGKTSPVATLSASDGGAGLVQAPS